MTDTDLSSALINSVAKNNAPTMLASVEVNLLTGGGPANSTSTITQYLYNYGIKSLDFGFGSAGAIVMTVLVLLLSSVYIKRAIS